MTIQSNGANLARKGFGVTIANISESIVANSLGSTLVDIKGEIEILAIEFAGNIANIGIDFYFYDQAGNIAGFPLVQKNGLAVLNYSFVNIYSNYSGLFISSVYDTSGNNYKAILSNPIRLSNGCKIINHNYDPTLTGDIYTEVLISKLQG